MKTFNAIAAQGEITIRRVSKTTGRGLPKGYSAFPMKDGKLVIGHSETGHHHCLADVDGAIVGVLDKAPEGMRILYMILNNPTALEHLRPHDTHESLMLEPGEYEVRIAREYDPYAELARKSAD